MNERIQEHWDIVADLLPLFLDEGDGLALLALLCNAGAKDWPSRAADPRLYALKAKVVRWACLAAWPARSWRDDHQGMPIFFVETRLLLEGRPLQLAFHFRASDTLPELPEGWPATRGRGVLIIRHYFFVIHFHLGSSAAVARTKRSIISAV
jgi:hypothetical protein